MPDERPERNQFVVLAIILVATFMILLDISIVNVAVPSIQRDLHASFAQVQPFGSLARGPACTALPRDIFTPSDVAELYRVRWEVGASREGRITQSVKVRPRSKDPDLVAGRRRGAKARRRSPPTTYSERSVRNAPGCNVQ